jgi:hypothetical protein
MKENLSMLNQNLLLSKKDKIKLVKERDGFTCAICFKDFKTNSDVTLDHWIPRSAGGSEDVSNLRLAHKKCNAWKSDRIPNEDGSIPPRPPRANYQDRRRRKQEILESLCTDCYDGRLLLQEETCPYCGSLAGPEDWPHWAKKPANKCDHTPPEWCWACSIGIVDRKPVFLILLEGK